MLYPSYSFVYKRHTFLEGLSIKGPLFFSCIPQEEK
ncbi:unnamed protein product [Bacillus thuringiensis DB27]|uniref:Uncharacterized protein n=1 Tax=Bacillus thuringiensis DB27 TaxID=1431339 RepID=W8YD65_BACTU|nr:unnamed protein product [Bacillus thuringiensis DB27]